MRALKSVDRRNLEDELLQLVDAMQESGFDTDDELSERMMEAMGYGESPIADMATLLKLKEEFYALPPDDLEHVLGGWTPCPERPAPQNYGLRARRHLEIGGDDRHMSGVESFSYTYSQAQVFIEINEGVTQKEAIKALLLAAEMIGQQWPELMAGKPAWWEPTESKEQRPAAPEKSTLPESLKRILKGLRTAAACV